MKNILVGAVAYAPQVMPIWDTIREYANEYFNDKLRLDYVLFSNYERQVEWLKEGKIDIAWNTNVAYVRSKFATKDGVKIILMRDTDIGFKTFYVAKKGKIKSLKDLGGKKFGLGSLDSAQAAIMPVYYLNKETKYDIEEFDSSEISSANPNKNTLALIRYNSDLGKHGDTGRSEFDVMDSIKKGTLDAGAVGSTTWARVLSDGSYPELESFYMSNGYCHCNFTALNSMDSTLQSQFVEMMLSQNSQKNNPKIAQMMSLEGLNKWVLCDEKIIKGYEEITLAMQQQNLTDNKV